MTRLAALLRNYWLFAVIVLVMLALFGAYLAGYRIDKAGFVRVGTLVVSGIPDGTNVYIDQSRRILAENGSAKTSLTPGAHSVIVDVPGHQPWNEVFDVRTSEDTVLSPVLVPTQIRARKLGGDEAAAAAALLRSAQVPTKAAPLALSGGCVLVYASGPRIVADAATTSTCATLPSYLCTPGDEGCASTVIFAPRDAARTVIPYPGRDDALIISAGNLVYVVEVDPREPQFFAPLFKGATGTIAPFSASSTVIMSGADIIELSL